MGKRNFYIGLLTVVVTVTVSSMTFACSVPVFRYALERWERDEYRLVVAVNGELPPEHQSRVDELKRKCFDAEGFSNMAVHVIDISDKENEHVLEAYPAIAQVNEPTAFLLYPPGAYLDTVIFQEPLSDVTVQKLASSAFMEEVSLEILRGVSAVWIFVDSGNPVEDDKAFQVLAGTLDELNELVELPAGVIETSGNITGGLTEEDVRANYDPANFLESGIPLHIDFSVRRLTQDLTESVLRAILMHCEPDMKEAFGDQPMAFPVFGRGRFLFPLVGEGINADNIEMATSYVCGICSCQVKSGNPGVDLLSHVDWYSYLEGSEVVQDRELPPLTGTSELVESEEAPVEVIEAPVMANESSPLRRNVTIVIGVVLGVVAGVSLVIAKKK